MSDGNKITERRNFKRYHVKSGSIAITNKCFGEIIDISMNGMAFRYITIAEHQSEPSELKIFVADDSFLLKKIPYIFISDQFIENTFSFSSLIMKRSGIQFKKLNSQQINQLENFISKYALWEV